MKNITYILCILLVPSMMSCEKWFDVKPENQVSSKELYSTGEGYRNQLNGAYLELSSSSLYGQELTWGFLDILGQNYIQNRLRSPYVEVSQLLYGNTKVQALTESIWSKSFHVITNCNHILTNIAKESDDKFELGSQEKALITGEALGLRAFVHFDIFRLFGPSPKGNDQNAYVPYVKEYGSTVNIPVATKQFLENVVADLKKAKELVGSYDTVYPNSSFVGSVICRLEEGSNSFDNKYPLFFKHRGYRMNYYAITAMLARVYSYMGMKKEAYDAAYEVHTSLDQNGSKCFQFTDSWDMSDEYESNRKLYTDVIMGFRSAELPKLFAPYMNSTHGTLALRNLDKIFGESGSQDFRIKYLTKSLGSKTRVISIKNIQGGDDTPGSRISRVIIPVIRLSEMYYIMVEYLGETDLSKATALLEELRTVRGEIEVLEKITNADQLQKAILNDARREFIGEGQIFYMYKRLNLPIFDGLQEIDLKDKIKLPVPDSEVVLL